MSQACGAEMVSVLGWHLIVDWLISRLYALGWDGVNGFDGAIGCGLGGGEAAGRGWVVAVFLSRSDNVIVAVGLNPR